MEYQEFELSMLDSDYLVLDVEATGLDKDDQIIELSIVDQNSDVVFDRLIKATVPISESALSVHGISEQMLSDKPLWNEVMADVYEILQGKVVFMYNASFDAEIIVRSFINHQHPVPGFKAVCVAEWYANYFGARVRYRANKAAQKLDFAAEQQGIEREGNAHRALSDALLTRELLVTVGAQQRLYMC